LVTVQLALIEGVLPYQPFIGRYRSGWGGDSVDRGHKFKIAGRSAD
jgi:hypothetical protein